MDIVSDALAYVYSHEGNRLKVYDDKTGEEVVPGYTMQGHPTIAGGVALDTDGISQDESVYLTRNRVVMSYFDLRSYFGADRFAKFTPARQRALIDVRYQLGPLGYREFRKMNGYIDEDDWVGAAAELMDSHLATEAPKRTEANRDLLRDG